jgi:Holliday junction resolvase RusA-like endonuclease
MKSVANGTQKIKYYNKNGTVRIFTTDELHKALKRVRLDCSTIVATLVVIHKISFDIKMHMPSKKLGAVKKDFTPPRQTWMDGVH